MTTASPTLIRKEGGFVLIASLLMLLVMTILAVSMYHSFNEQENIASNTKEKGRAFQLAQSTLQYAEYILVHNSASLAAPINCPASTPLTTLTICSNSVNIANPSSSSNPMTLSNGMAYSSLAPAITLSTTGGNNTYYADPQFYLEYLGPAAGGLGGQVYQVTALSYGSTPNAVAVVQSTYELSSSTKCLSCTE
ncbi:pilus assembly protein PilX [Dyella sp. M7H15-1]|uniref:pilus assembly PilX family protein n=1 Tax=Dyella sp. M7H15-1 TaxID=2501295 RepID=UPI00100501DF|nr:PilX N-terminal domain-containing pilus assembly protein [Dyella sp. M7H15-1]QAU24264.1 pilus assembly protein PilX [Dyella sp. M7H15-1]